MLLVVTILSLFVILGGVISIVSKFNFKEKRNKEPEKIKCESGFGAVVVTNSKHPFELEGG